MLYLFTLLGIVQNGFRPVIFLIGIIIADIVGIAIKLSEIPESEKEAFFKLLEELEE